MFSVSIRAWSCCWRVGYVRNKDLEKCVNGYVLYWLTLKRVPIDENLDCFDASSGNGGNKLATKEHLDASNKA